MHDRVVVAVLADREDAQVGLAVVDELVGELRALGLREEVARADPEALVAGVQPAGAREHEEAFLLAAMPVVAAGALARVHDVEVHADAAQSRDAPDQGRQAEALAAGLGLVLLIGSSSMLTSQSGRPSGALDELLGAHAVGLADPPFAGGEDAALDPAGLGSLKSAATSVQASTPASLAIDREERMDVAEHADELTDGRDPGPGKRRGWRETAATVRTGAGARTPTRSSGRSRRSPPEEMLTLRA